MPIISETANLATVTWACGVLAAFGVGFLGMAWWLLRLE